MLSKKFSLRKKRHHKTSPSHTPTFNSTISDTPIHEETDGSPLTATGTPLSHQTSPPILENSEGDPGPLGLNVVYTPQYGHKADIVFVHGLGGSSRWTWSKYRKPELFWPLTFLPLEPDLCLSRILSFGYNAKFRKPGNASTVVLDFAKELLFDLKYANDGQKENLNIGAVPLLFVVHSMGGLIVKEAYMQGQNDPEYEKIVKAISAILFLATPHRGTNLAAILNRLLQSTQISSSKLYISELSRDSFTLQKLNEQFRHIAPKLDIVSFYETQPTSLGLKSARVMILEKDSSVLGYPGETSKALNADHHDVCKYDSPGDPNYITVRNALKSIVSKIIAKTPGSRLGIASQRRVRDLKLSLAISDLPDLDYLFFQDQWTEGTNSWFLEQKPYSRWLDETNLSSCILWVNGGAATGKSVLSSFVIKNLLTGGACCQYFFIRFVDMKKRSLSLLLRSIAYQISQDILDFRTKLIELADEGIDFETADPKTIWERVFKSVLFSMDSKIPLYWVIDGLDEAVDARSVIKLFQDLGMSSVPIKIAIFSRITPDITTAMKKIPSSVRQETVSIEGHPEDIYAHIRQELSLSGTDEYKERIVKRIVEGARSNFLWVRLAVEKLNSCHTVDDVENALHELPSGMEALYDRMGLLIAQNPSPSGRALATAVLQCVTCSFRALTVSELSLALDEEFSGMLNFQQSIVELCGGFIIVDNGSNVVIIHHSAREYLISSKNRPLSIDYAAANEQLFKTCMRCLMTTGLRAKVSRGEIHGFLDYSANWWSSHLPLVPAAQITVFKTLNKFLTGHWVLTWIHILAILKRLRILVRASKNLSKYSAARQKIQDPSLSDVNCFAEQDLLETWAIDLVKIVGKFGIILRGHPDAIYKSVPPFCPHNSAIYRQFGKAETKTLAISGISIHDWDDYIARLSFGGYASYIVAEGPRVAVMASSGNVLVYDASDFEEAMISPLIHGERVYRIALNRTGTLIVTYGYQTTKVWEISTGTCKLTAKAPESRPRPLTMHFKSNDNILLVGSDDRRIRALDLLDPSPTWELVADFEEPELEGHLLNSSSYMALNKNGDLLAVAYRGHPLSAWEVDGPVHINHCWRAREVVARGEILEAIWHPHNPELLGLYIEGVVFKWNPYEGDPEELETGASRLAMSADGSLFATGDVRGTIKVHTTSEFRLLYQLASQDSVLGLAFSPGLGRFYDIRGSYGNVWEPNSLARYAERLEKGPDSDSETGSVEFGSMVITGMPQRIDRISVIAASPLGGLYCSGTEYGKVRLFHIQHGFISDVYTSKGFLGIEHLVWSHDGRYICFSDSGKNTFAFSIRLQNKDFGSVLMALVLEMSMKSATTGAILQVLFSPSSTGILISTSSSLCILSIKSGSVMHSLEWPPECRKWLVHPQDPELVLWVGPQSAGIMNWSLTEMRTFLVEFPVPTETPSLDGNAYGKRSVDCALITHDKSHIFIQISAGKFQKDKTFFWLPTSSVSQPLPLDCTSEATEMLITTQAFLVQDMASHIMLALSFLAHDRLVFLSKDYSICSVKIQFDREDSSSSAALRRLSSASVASSMTASGDNRSYQNAGQAEHGMKNIILLPSDWVGKDCLTMCNVWTRERSFVCPRNGEVAVVKSASLV
ncbi:uncharacterized protein N7500_001831 [Penicillium coprophilum]|uniref:uncharacterized protein n=1 Tax=Penicillium coprophilum TaxID=36646 RepID=UPI002397712A|nr:uncharacterized protein N7500_001831 [Penicillium coprophilum]KAJ5173900.1 hypothetical protein N7500_001831 [Penicillium coprophilum]